MDSDTAMRLAAFAHVKQLIELRDALTAGDLKPGFQFEGVRLPLINPQRGIFKPTQMKYLILTHGHNDHFGGAKYLQDTYHARVLMSAPDWDMVAKVQPRARAPSRAELPARGSQILAPGARRRRSRGTHRDG